MYLRETRQKRADGSFVTHLQLAERLRQLARSILKKCHPEEMVQHSSQWRLVDAWPYARSTSWKRFGSDWA